MTILSAYAATLPTNVLLGSAVLYFDSATPWGVSIGEITTNIPHEYDNLGFDGKILPIVGLDRRMGGVPYVEGTFMEMTAARALELEPGGSTATAGGVTTITPKPYGDFLVAGDYKADVRTVLRMGGSSAGFCAIEFEFGLLMAEMISGSSASNGTYKIRIEARQDAAAASLGVAPYTIKIADTIVNLTAT